MALHEFGHVLGLTHPDEAGQSVTALMNSMVSNLDALAADDINGIRSIYGSGVTSNVSFPPRNETNDFNAQLQPLYQNRPRRRHLLLRRRRRRQRVAHRNARYRVGLCSHSVATARTFMQIDNEGMSARAPSRCRAPFRFRRATRGSTS